MQRQLCSVWKHFWTILLFKCVFAHANYFEYARVFARLSRINRPQSLRLDPPGTNAHTRSIVPIIEIILNIIYQQKCPSKKMRIYIQRLQRTDPILRRQQTCNKRNSSRAGYTNASDQTNTAS